MRCSKKATGKVRDQWINDLDKMGGAGNMFHKDIARMFWDKGLVKNGWWCQMVTTGYEYAKGLRITGQTESQGFEIGLRKTIPKSKSDICGIPSPLKRS